MTISSIWNTALSFQCLNLYVAFITLHYFLVFDPWIFYLQKRGYRFSERNFVHWSGGFSRGSIDQADRDPNLCQVQMCVSIPSERPHYPIVYLGCSPLQERCLGLEGASRTPARSTLLGMGNLYSTFWSSDYLGISPINCFIQNTSNLVHKNSFTMGCMIRTVKCS